MRLQFSRRSGFTLFEILIVVMIIGLLAGIGIPSVVRSIEKTGTRKAITDFEEACKAAREGAIFSGKTVEMVLQQNENGTATFTVGGYGGGGEDEYGEPRKGRGGFSSTLPEGIEVEGVGLYGLDYTPDFESGTAVHVKFKPNGTSEDFKVIIYQAERNERIGLAVDLVTGRPDVVMDPLAKWR